MNKLTCIILLFFSLFCFSQNETNNWVFGNQIILNFSNSPNTPPTPLFISDLLASSGSSCISDKKGQLLLYSDGVSVWNKKNLIIPNSILLFGDNEMAQSSIIIPKPGSSTIYYIITVKTFLDIGPPDIPTPRIDPGLYYSIIDVSIDDGIILSKNQKLLSFEVGKISAVHHKDGNSIWFTTTGREKETDKFLSFYTFKVDENGINTQPVISEDLRHEGSFDGFLKFSPDGTKIASSNLEKELVIFDFDNETGIVSNKLNLIKTSVFFDQPSVFGVEFSNDSKILYTTSYNDSQLTETIFQYDLTNLHPTEKIKKLITRNQYRYSSLQLSNNSKIYKTQTLLNNKAGNFLDVINSPDKVGNNCDLQTDAILVDKRAGKGLPNFIQSYFRTRILNEKSCVNEVINFEVDTYAAITAANWDFGDGNTANVITPQHTFSIAGTYNVKASITVNNKIITTFKDITIYPLPV